MSSIIIFYISSFFIAFFLCIPIGPVNLEIFHNALKKHYPQAISVAIGGAVGDSVWATLAFFGISPFDSSPHLEAAFFLFTTLITAGLGIAILKDSKALEKREEQIVTKIKRKRWALLKGLTLVLVNPLGIVSWMICLQFLRKNNIFIPMTLNYEILFFVVVTAGAASYFLLVVLITNKMKSIFNPERTVKITRFLGYLLLTFSAYFLFYSVKAFFFNNHAVPAG
ncbi:MAG: LysE family transporter [bacterium]|nr:LysE family transporter [bacterium]